MKYITVSSEPDEQEVSDKEFVRGVQKAMNFLLDLILILTVLAMVFYWLYFTEKSQTKLGLFY